MVAKKAAAKKPAVKPKPLPEPDLSDADYGDDVTVSEVDGDALVTIGDYTFKCAAGSVADKIAAVRSGDYEKG